MDPRTSKPLTWALFALCGRSVFGKESGADFCSAICGSTKENLSSSEACAKAHRSFPRPKIGRVCENAFDDAFRLTCTEACNPHDSTAHHAPLSYAEEACSKRKREKPKPVVYKACLDGFKAGLEATASIIAERRKEVASDLMECVKAGVSMPEKDRSEPGRLKNLGKDGVAENASRVEEELEEARREVGRPSQPHLEHEALVVMEASGETIVKDLDEGRVEGECEADSTKMISAATHQTSSQALPIGNDVMQRCRSSKDNSNDGTPIERHHCQVQDTTRSTGSATQAPAGGDAIYDVEKFGMQEGIEVEDRVQVYAPGSLSRVSETVSSDNDGSKNIFFAGQEKSKNVVENPHAQ